MSSEAGATVRAPGVDLVRDIPDLRGSSGISLSGPCDDRPVAVQVLIVDDHASFRRFARLLLLAAGFDVVGEAAGAESARALIALLRPDAVLLDVMLPDGCGLDVARELAREPDSPRVVLTSSRSRSDFARVVRLARGMHVHSEARVERSGTGRVARRDVTQRSAAVLACAVVVAVLNAVDVARQARLGVADAGTWVAGAAIFWALGIAVVIGRWPERRRTALLMLAWLLAGVAADAATRLAGFAGGGDDLAVGGRAAARVVCAHGAVVSGRPGARPGRAYLSGGGVLVTLLWQLAPALFADFRCAGCSPHVPSLLFTVTSWI